MKHYEGERSALSSVEKRVNVSCGGTLSIYDQPVKVIQILGSPTGTVGTHGVDRYYGTADFGVGYGFISSQTESPQ